MSYRCSINIVVNGRYVLSGYYRNWSDENLFYEAVALETLFHGCQNLSAFMKRMEELGMQRKIIGIPAKEFEEDNLAMDQSIIVDVSNSWIYSSFHILSMDEILTYPVVGEPLTFAHYMKRNSVYAARYYSEKLSIFNANRDMEFANLLQYYAIDLSQTDTALLLDLYRKYESLRNHCSIQTAEAIIAYRTHMS